MLMAGVVDIRDYEDSQMCNCYMFIITSNLAIDHQLQRPERGLNKFMEDMPINSD